MCRMLHLSLSLIFISVFLSTCAQIDLPEPSDQDWKTIAAVTFSEYESMLRKQPGQALGEDQWPVLQIGRADSIIYDLENSGEQKVVKYNQQGKVIQSYTLVSNTATKVVDRTYNQQGQIEEMRSQYGWSKWRYEEGRLVEIQTSFNHRTVRISDTLEVFTEDFPGNPNLFKHQYFRYNDAGQLKSMVMITENLDTTTSPANGFLDDHQLFNYNENGTLATYEQLFKRKNGEVTQHVRRIYTYDTQGKLENRIEKDVVNDLTNNYTYTYRFQMMPEFYVLERYEEMDGQQQLRDRWHFDQQFNWTLHEQLFLKQTTRRQIFYR